MSSDSFRNIIDRDLYRRLEFIRTYGNDAAHNSGEKAKKIAEVCLKYDSFRNIIDRDLYRRLEFIRTYGNDAAHNSGEKAKKIAEVCLKYLFYFTDWIAYCYGSDYEEREFDPMLLEQDDVLAVPQANPEIDLKALIEENKSLKEELSKRRAQQQETYVTKPLDLSEYSTRELFMKNENLIQCF